MKSGWIQLQTRKMDKTTQIQKEISNLQAKQIQLAEKIQKTSNLDKSKLKNNWLEEQELKKALQEKQSKLKSILKKQKKSLSEQQIKNDRLNISEFSSGKIDWKLNERKQLYPEWNGFIDNKHIFTLKQSVFGYQLAIINSTLSGKDFKKMQESAEFFLQNFTFKNK